VAGIAAALVPFMAYVILFRESFFWDYLDESCGSDLGCGIGGFILGVGSAVMGTILLIGLAVVGASRLGRPDSWWATHRYAPHKLQAAHERYDEASEE
jgi:hypothetical protein